VKNQLFATEASSEAVARVATSSTFARAPRAVALLRYLVGEVEAGRAAEIKETTIASDFFRRTGYDPKIDAQVRVEAAKLRSLLARYYETEGTADPFRVDIPKGSYVPVISTAELARAGTADPPLPEIIAARPVHTRGNARTRWIAVAAAAIVVVAVVAVLATSRRVTPLASGPPSIAVLPFADHSSTKQHEHVADGLTEELIHLLSSQGTMRVAPRAAVFRYKGKRPEAQALGRELNVHALLDGSVRIEGSRIRVIAELVDARRGVRLWHGSYDAAREDVLTVQRTIASSIAKAFYLDVASARKALVRPHTASVDAYFYYLRAAHLADSDIEDLRSSLKFFQAAVDADPNYGLAWAGLARALTTLVGWEYEKREAVLARATDAAERALKAAPSLPEAHLAMARVRAVLHRDLPRAEESFKRAIELDPGAGHSRADYARLVLLPGRRFDEARNQFVDAVAADPTENLFRNGLARTYLRLHRYPEAEEQLRESLRLVRRAPETMMLLGMVAGAQGRHADAVPHYEAALALHRRPWPMGHLGYTFAKVGRTAEAEALLDELRRSHANEHIEAAAILAGMGATQRSIEALRRGLGNGWRTPTLDDYRFRELTR
jgi:TolB-like protein/Flp pilus assembly protein TadD